MIQWKFQQPGLRLRHPLARFAAALLGVVVVVAVGLFALGALAIAAVVLTVAVVARRFRGPAPATPAPDMARPPLRNEVIDGEFVVVDPASAGQRR